LYTLCALHAVIILKHLCTGSAYNVWQIEKNEGDFLNLTCATSSSFVEWRSSKFHGKIFANSQISFENNLMISKAAVDNSGVYSCNDGDSGNTIIQYNVTVNGNYFVLCFVHR